MGRNLDPVRKQFRDSKERINQQNDTYHECLHCIGAKEELAKTDKDEAAKIVIAKIHGSVAGLRRHLGRCEHTPEARMARAAALEGTPVPIDASEGQRQLSLGQVGLVIKRLLEFQARHRLADAFIEDDTTRRLVESLDPRFVGHMPCRRTFGGPILKKRAMEVIEEEADDLMNLQRQSGGRVNFLSDVWINIAKAHLLAAQLGLFGVFTTLGLSPTGSRHDGLELASQMEKIMEEAEARGWNIGGVVTDDAAQCGRARRILALRWPRVIFVKCFAHDMNNLMKSVLRINEFRSVSDKAQQIVKFLNASSAKWLPRAHEVMIQTYGRKWRFKALCATRWNSMQGCFASLLRVKTAMRIFAVKYSADPDFKASLAALEDATFWSSLKEAEQAVNPICFASFKLQSDENTLADVVIVFRDLYDKYSTSSYRENLLPLIEARWAGCEQPLFMLALYLHPAYYKDAIHLLATKVSGRRSICEIAEYYYRRLLGGEPVTLAGELDDWLSGTYMGKTPKELKNFETSSLPPLPAFWRHWKNNNPEHCLPKLAIAVLSVTVNTATCERYFSELALIHTALRNRLDPEKARYIAAIRKYLREKLSKKVKPRSPAKRMTRSREPERISAFSTPERRSSSSCTPSPLTTSAPARDAQAEASDTGDSDVDEEDAGEEEDVSIEDAVAYWDNVLSAMADGDDSELQALLQLVNTIHRNESGRAGVEEEKKEEEEEEDPPLPERLPFPEEDNRRFPQERIMLCGLRGRKVSLGQLRTDDCSRQLEFRSL